VSIPNLAWGEPTARTARSFTDRVSGVAKAFTRRGKTSSLRRALSMPLTLAAYGCIDYGVWQASALAGWIVTGVSLMVLEFQVSDDDA